MTGVTNRDYLSKTDFKASSLPRPSTGFLTPFGKELRRLRFEHCKRLFDLAQDMNVSSSSVSAWETGRREISEGEIQKIGHIFSLTETEISRLREAAELSKRRIVIEANSIEARQLANRIKKRINELTVDTISQIMDHLKWTSNRRIRPDIKVPRKSILEIERVAQIVRDITKTGADEPFDIVKFYDEFLDKTFFHFLENGASENTAFEIWDDLEMPKDTRGMTTMYPPHIVISNSVYEGAAQGEHSGRWIMSHELGHLLLLHGFALKSGRSVSRGPEYLEIPSEGNPQDPEGDLSAAIPFAPPKPVKRIPREQSAENQADDFAGELLMPRKVCRGMLPHNISRRYGVSIPNASKRLRFISKLKILVH
jgi:transcriptional regulator with XRE-family HTH domain